MIRKPGKRQYRRLWEGDPKTLSIFQYRLNQRYDAINMDLFGGELADVPICAPKGTHVTVPKYRVRLFPGLMEKRRLEGRALEHGEIYIDPLILIDPRIAEETLIHEMIHVLGFKRCGVGENISDIHKAVEFAAHGPAFIAELRRLGRLGHRWAQKESRRYQRQWRKLIRRRESLLTVC